MSALDIVALTVPPDHGYGPLLAGLKADEVPRLAAALTLDLRSGEAAHLDLEHVKREAVAYLHAAQQEAARDHRGWHVQPRARAHLTVARFISDTRAASWILDAGPGSLGACLWRVRSGRGWRPDRAFWAVAERMPGAPYAMAERLTCAAKALGPARVFVGEDGLLHTREGESLTGTKAHNSETGA